MDGVSGSEQSDETAVGGNLRMQGIMTTEAPRLADDRKNLAGQQTFVLGHRPELDGVRGISILLVLILHLRLYEMTGVGAPGGSVGVDIFFVLSGFLITSLLVQEFDRTGTISLKRFYLRRAFRLGPALVVLIAIVCSIAIFTNLKQESFTGAWLALSYVSNWLYAFRLYSWENPFGVTWSLAIEEQFYLLWPLLLVIALKLRIKRSWLLGGAVAAVAFVAAYRFELASHGAHLARMYFATDTRADALLIGCIVGLSLSWGFTPRSPRLVLILKIMAAFGIVLLGYFALFTSTGSAMLYFGGFTLAAMSVGAILTVLMLYPPSLALTILRCSPLVWIGRVSYGLYLWHGAVIEFIFPKRGIPSISQLLSGVALSLLLPALSFYLIEQRCLALKDQLKM
jgi:peptidoglycan/LPS O-acetylase OafA/YrhL